MNDKSPEDIVQRYNRLIGIARDLASTVDLDILLKKIIQTACELTDAEDASILLYDEKKNQLFFRAATNTEDLKKMADLVVPAQSIAGWVALNRQPVIVPDVHQDNRWFSNVGEKLGFQTRSIIAAPMVARDNLIGVLETLNKQHVTFNEEDLDILQALAAQAAVAIENTRLFEQSDLVSELVHELRTPLASINAITYLLSRRELTDSQRISLAQTIQEEVKRLSQMTTIFLDLARLESGRMKFELFDFDPRLLVNECCNITAPRAKERGIQIHVNCPDEIPMIQADRDKIKQVILNLLSNAIKYNRRNGSIAISLQPEDANLSLAIEDTGIGIPPESIHQLFSKYYRGKVSEKVTPGAGLGLYISKRIIENHNGSIEVQSTVNSGTTFTVRLPLKSKPDSVKE